MKHTHSQAAQLRSQRKTYKGFTLIELMISMTITLIIVGLLMGMTKMAVGAWQRTNAKARSSRLAQEVFDSVGKDLEGIVIRTGNNYEWLLIEDITSSMSAEDKGPTEGPGNSVNKQMVNPLEITFFSAVTDRYNGQINSSQDMGGDISMVRYRLIHKDLIGTTSGDKKPVFALYRDLVDPDYTFHHALAKESIATDDLKDTPWDGRAGRPTKDYTSDGIVEEQNYLAENIFDFTFSFNFEYTLPNGKKGYYRAVINSNGDSNGLSIKGNDIFIIEGASRKSLQTLLPSGASSPRLSGADISILVLSDGGMNALKNKNIASEEDLSEFLNENGHLYSKSVILPQP